MWERRARGRSKMDLWGDWRGFGREKKAYQSRIL